MLTISIKTTRNDAAKLRALKPEFAMSVISRGMARAGELIVGRIREERMSFRSASTLGVVTGNARRSLRAAYPQIDGNAVTMGIGSNVGYVQAHEFGFEGTVSVRAHSRRAPRRVLSSETNSFTGFTKKKYGARGATQTVRAHTRKVKIPERRMIRTGAEDHKQIIADEISAEIRREIA